MIHIGINLSSPWSKAEGFRHLKVKEFYVQGNNYGIVHGNVNWL